MSGEERSGLPDDLASPAKRALVGARYTKPEQFTEVSERDVMKLHGMGSKAMSQIRRDLAAKGRSFAEEERR